MPAKSKAQIRKLAELEAQGKVKAGTAKEWSKGVDVGALPERVSPKKAPRSIQEIREIRVKKYGK